MNTKRNRDALAISDGACNPRAIINAMVRALQEMGDADHPTILGDPALKLMTHQLAFLQGIPTCESLYDWSDWRKACEGEGENERERNWNEHTKRI